MDSTTLAGLFRADVRDQEIPYLWSDEEVFQYMNDAYRQFVRFTGGVADFTSSATQVPIVSGNPIGALHPSILRIMSANRQSDDGVIKIINFTDAALYGRNDYGCTSLPRIDNTPGPVNYMVIGMQEDAARWVHVPVVNDVAKLYVYRLPLGYITDFGQAFTDVAEDHHFHFLKWMRHLAYQKPDADTFDGDESEKQEKQFRAYCYQVVEERDRRKHKTRVVQYRDV